MQDMIDKIPDLSRETIKPFSLATICIKGHPVNGVSANRERTVLLQGICRMIQEQKWSPDVVLFPGGFFHLPVHVGHMEHAGRIRELSRQSFSNSCYREAKTLGTTLVIGIDSVPCQQYKCDQLCVAWNGEKITGIGRKVFPMVMRGDEDDDRNMVVYARDLITEQRLARFNEQMCALLCSCYDIFGCREISDILKLRRRNIRWLDNGKKLLNRDRDNRYIRDVWERELLGWDRLVKKATVGLAAIHQFNIGSGRWQWCGLQYASTVIGGQMAFGAAHFNRLPKKPDSSALAAKRGSKPRLHDCFHFKESAIIRLFKV